MVGTSHVLAANHVIVSFTIRVPRYLLIKSSRFSKVGANVPFNVAA